MTKERKIRVGVAMIFILGAIVVAAAGDLTPATVENDLYRTAGGTSLSGFFWQGSTLRLTNWVCYADATGVTTQNLTDCRITIALGNETASTIYTGTVQVAAAGSFWADLTVPTNAGSQYIECTLTDTGQTPNVVFTYPWYPITTKARIAD